MATFRVLIISDIHMFRGEPNIGSPSWVSAAPRFMTPNRSPLKALEKLFSPKDNIDWILCPGDLADRHDEVCQGVAWQTLENLRKSLHIRHLFATVGNHDVDSRHVTDRHTLPTSAIRALQPHFPHSNARNERLKNEFWANGIAVHQEATRDMSLVILNSSEFHGIDSGQIQDGLLIEQEWNRGRVSPDAIEKLRVVINGTSTSRNILMLHHHLLRANALDLDTSVLINANDILEIASNSNKEWMILHGHLHIPMINSYVGSNEINILSSGSAGGKTWTGNTAQTPDNQVHLVEFSDEPAIKAIVHSWNWINTIGWQPANSSDHGLPRISGFGSGITTRHASDQIEDLFADRDELLWAEIAEAIPDIKYLRPSQLTELLDSMQRKGHYLLHSRGDTIPSVIRRANQ